jgi:hypothetical protein
MTAPLREITRAPAAGDRSVNLLRAGARAIGWDADIEWAQAFDHPQLGRLLTLWREKARNGLPGRADLGARELKEFLPNLWIVKRVEDSGRTRYQFRLIGTVVAQVVGDYTGHYIEELVPVELLPRWLLLCEVVLGASAPIRVKAKVDLPMANYLAAEIFIAPFAGDNGSPPSKIAAATYFTSRLPQH